MMRLINADDLLDWFSKNFSETDKVDNREIYEVISNFPTAYDIEKVAGEIANACKFERFAKDNDLHSVISMVDAVKIVMKLE